MSTEVHYNKLLHINKAKLLNMDKISELKSLIRSFGYQDTLGIYRLHKHFDLKEGERIVWEKGESNLYSSKVVNQNIGFPFVFVYINSNWQPTEYQTMNSDYWDKITKEKKFKEFQEIFLSIVGHECFLYGLGLNTKDSCSTLEKTNQKERTQIVYKEENSFDGAIITKYFGDCQCQEFCSCCCRCKHACKHSCKHGSCKSHK